MGPDRDRGRKAFLLLFPLSLVGARLLAWALPLLTGGSFTVERLASWIPLRCPFHRLTGWLCPTCGLGRSLVATWTGRLNDAWAYHPGGPLLLSLGILAWVGAIANLTLRPLPLRKWVWISGIAAYAIWGFGRNIFGPQLP